MFRSIKIFGSIKAKTLLLLIFVLSTIFVGVGIFLNKSLETILFKSVDETLNSKLQIISSLIEHEKGKLHMEFVEISMGDYSVPYSGHYFQISFEDGTALWKSPSLGKDSLPYLQGGLTIDDISYDTVIGPGGKPARLLSKRYSVDDWEMVVLVADNVTSTYLLLKSFRKILWYSIPLAIILSAIGALVVVVLSFRSVNSLSEAVERITEENLNESVDTEKLDSELVILAESFNTMLDRLDKAFLTQRKFLSDASHELRTPVSIIRSYCDITLKRDRSAKEYKETLGVINGAVHRMAGLVEKILDVARLENKGTIFKKEHVELSGILNNVYKLALPLAHEKAISLTIAGIDRPIEIMGQAERLSELFLNLIDNAVKYNRKGGSVNISVSVSGVSVRIIVADTGVGISPDEIDKIFVRFYRVDKARTGAEGTGLGLNIAKSIVEAHNGTIEVKSSLGEGTRFIVDLPCI